MLQMLDHTYIFLKKYCFLDLKVLRLALASLLSLSEEVQAL